jgi:hypothetical protein
MLLERDIHFGVATRRGRIDGRPDSFNVTARDRPLRVAQDYESDFAAGKVLLMSNVFVGRQQNFEPGGFSDLQQLAVSKFLLPAIDCFHHGVAFKGMSQRRGDAVIEQNEHQLCQQEAAQEGARRDSAPQIRARPESALALRGTSP